MVSDMRADEKAGVVIHLLERGDHFEKVIQRFGFAAQHAAGVFNPGIFGEHFSDIIRDLTVRNARAFEHVPDEHVKVKVTRDTQAATLFQECADNDELLMKRLRVPHDRL